MVCELSQFFFKGKKRKVLKGQTLSTRNLQPWPQSPRKVAQKVREWVEVGVGRSGGCCGPGPPPQTHRPQPRSQHQPSSLNSLNPQSLSEKNRGDGAGGWPVTPGAGAPILPTSQHSFLITAVSLSDLEPPEHKGQVCLAHHYVPRPQSICDTQSDWTNETRVENKILPKM